MKKKTVIIAEGRCGSELVIQDLKFHQQLEVVSEILHVRGDFFPYPDIIEDLYGFDISKLGELTIEERDRVSTVDYLDACLKRADVFKLLYYQVEGRPELLKYLAARGDVQIILMTRSNILARIVSEKVAHKTKKWHIMNEEPLTDKVNVSLGELVGGHKYYRKMQQYLLGLFTSCRYITYEQLISNLPLQLKRIHKFVGLEGDLTPHYKFKKSIQQPVSFSIENFDELRDEYNNSDATDIEGMDGYFSASQYHFTSNWFSGHVPDWYAMLLKYKDTVCQFLEIGSYEGRSAIWMFENILTDPYSSLTCIEPGFAIGNEILQNNLKSGGFESRCILYDDTSQYWLPRLQTYKRKYNFIYIDGSHTSRDCLFDAVNSFPLLKKGGLLCFDDYEWEGFNEYGDGTSPKSAIDSFITCYKNDINVLHKGYQVWIQKKN